MSCWYCIPSCRPAEAATACLDKWRKQGYRIALLRQGDPIAADVLIPTGEYLGWARSTNILAREVLRRDIHARWIIGGGDDYLPDPNLAAWEISDQCCQHFAGTWGVMQPTGDRWQDTAMSRAQFGQDRGALIDRVAGSPWMGREWCELAYMGHGPMWDGYHHLFADEELQEVAIRAGCFWQRRDLVQYHDHAMRKPVATADDWPEHLKPINTTESWQRHQSLFDERKAKGFPGWQPIAA